MFFYNICFIQITFSPLLIIDLIYNNYIFYIAACQDYNEAEQKEAEAEDVLEQTRKTMEEITEVTKQLAVSVEENQREVEKWFHQADEYLHKENVKVYRNVQAVVVEEVGKKAEAVIRAQEERGKKYSKPVLILLILTLLASLGNIVLTLLIKFGLF